MRGKRWALYSLAAAVTVLGCGESAPDGTPTAPAPDGAPTAPDTASRASIRGRVVISGAGELPALGVSLVGPVTRAVTTRPDGSFVVEGLPEGSYLASVTAPSSVERVATRTVEVARDQAATLPDLAFTGTGRVRGKVTLGAATGVAGVLVVPGGGGATATTDDGGTYEVEVRAGETTVAFVKEGYTSATLAARVRWNTTDVARDVALARGAQLVSVVGSVSLVGDGSPDGVEVALEGTSTSTLSAADGSFILADVPVGFRTLRFKKDAYEESAPVVVLPGESFGRDLDDRLFPLRKVELTRGKRLRTYSQHQSLVPAANRAAFVYSFVGATGGLTQVFASGTTERAFTGTLLGIDSDGGRIVVAGQGYSLVTIPPVGPEYRIETVGSSGPYNVQIGAGLLSCATNSGLFAARYESEAVYLPNGPGTAPWRAGDRLVFSGPGDVDLRLFSSTRFATLRATPVERGFVGDATHALGFGGGKLVSVALDGSGDVSIPATSASPRLGGSVACTAGSPSFVFYDGTIRPLTASCDDYVETQRVGQAVLYLASSFFNGTRGAWRYLSKSSAVGGALGAESENLATMAGNDDYAFVVMYPSQTLKAHRLSNGQVTTIASPVTDLHLSPDGTKLLFRKDGALLLLNAVGTAPTEIVPASKKPNAVRWSPGSTKVAFIDEGGTRPLVTTVSVAGGAFTALVAASPYSAAFWESETSIVLARDDDNGRFFQRGLYRLAVP